MGVLSRDFNRQTPRATGGKSPLQRRTGVRSGYMPPMPAGGRCDPDPGADPARHSLRRIACRILSTRIGEACKAAGRAARTAVVAAGRHLPHRRRYAFSSEPVHKHSPQRLRSRSRSLEQRLSAFHPLEQAPSSRRASENSFSIRLPCHSSPFRPPPLRPAYPEAREAIPMTVHAAGQTDPRQPRGTSRPVSGGIVPFTAGPRGRDCPPGASGRCVGPAGGVYPGRFRNRGFDAARACARPHLAGRSAASDRGSPRTVRGPGGGAWAAQGGAAHLRDPGRDASSATTSKLLARRRRAAIAASGMSQRAGTAPRRRTAFRRRAFSAG